MTDYALNAVVFVLYISFIVLGNFLVTGRAFRSQVFSSQFKPRFTMVKSFDRPALQPVTLRTIHHSVYQKLPCVRVFVAT